MEVDGVVLRILLALFLEFFVEEFPGERLIIRYHNLLELCPAHGTLLVLQDEPESQGAGDANILVATLTHSKVLQLIITEQAVVHAELPLVRVRLIGTMIRFRVHGFNFRL